MDSKRTQCAGAGVTSEANVSAPPPEVTAPSPSIAIGMSASAANDNSVGHERYLPRIEFGPTFTPKLAGGRIEFPSPDAREVKASADLAYRMRDMIRGILPVDAGQLDVTFGMANVDAANGWRLHFQIDMPAASKNQNVLGIDMKVPVYHFLNGICDGSNNGQADLAMPQLDEQLCEAVAASVAREREDKGGSRYPAGICVNVAEVRLGVPRRIAPPPAVEETTEMKSEVGFIDEVGRSAREIRILTKKRKSVRARFDVERDLESLCNRLINQDFCRFSLRSDIDRAGTETITLTCAEIIQLDMFDN